MQRLPIRSTSLVLGVLAASLWTGIILKASADYASVTVICRPAALRLCPVGALLVVFGAAFGLHATGQTAHLAGIEITAPTLAYSSEVATDRTGNVCAADPLHRSESAAGGFPDIGFREEKL
jgi:hypothetical protein